MRLKVIALDSLNLETTCTKLTALWKISLMLSVNLLIKLFIQKNGNFNAMLIQILNQSFIEMKVIYSERITGFIQNTKDNGI